MALTRNIHTDRTKRVITRSIVTMCADLGISVIAEGIECAEEAISLRELGVRLFQGYFFARPAVEQLPVVSQDLMGSLERQFETALPLRSGT